MSDSETVEARLALDISDLTAKLDMAIGKWDDMATHLGTATGQMSQHLEAVTGSTMNVGKAIQEIHGTLTTAFQVTGIAALYEGVKMVGSEIGELTQRAVEFKTMAAVTGLTTDQIQALGVAADDTGASLEQITRVSERLSNMLGAARKGSGEAIEKFHQLGVTNQELEDPLVGTNDLLVILHNRLNDASTAIATQAALVSVLGPRYAMASRAIAEYVGTAEGVAATNEANHALSEKEIEDLNRLHAQYARLGTDVENIKERMLAAAFQTLPEAIGGWFNDLARGAELAAHALEHYGDAKRQVGGSMAMGWAARQAEEAANAQIAAGARVTVAAGTATATQIKLHKAVTVEDLQDMHDSLAAFKSGTEQRLAAAKNYYAQVKQFYQNDQSKDAVDKVKEAHKEELAEQRAFDDRSVEQLKSSLDLQLKIKEDHLKEELKSIDLFLEQKQKDIDNADARAKADTASDNGRLALIQKQTDAEYDQKTISAQRYFETSMGLIASEEANERRAFDIELSNLQIGTKEYTDKQAEETEALQKYAEKRLEIIDKETKDETKRWQTMLGPMERGFDNALEGMLNHTQTFKQGMLKMGQDIAKEFIENSVHKMVQAFIQGEVTKTMALEASTATAAGLQAAGVATEKTSATQSITVDAGKAAAGAASSVSSIPYIGPALAALAYASTYALVIAAASFAKGGVIPEDMLANVHGGEMVLPKNISEGLQNMIANGGASGGGHTVHQTLHVKALDGRSVAKILRKQGPALGRILHREFINHALPMQR